MTPTSELFSMPDGSKRGEMNQGLGGEDGSPIDATSDSTHTSYEKKEGRPFDRAAFFSIASLFQSLICFSALSL